jgi:hypothetical protein
MPQKSSRKILLILSITIGTLTAACGGGGNSDSSNTTIPSVAGFYSFDTNRIPFECTDGSRGELPPISLGVEVIQNENRIAILNDTVDNPVGFNIIESSLLQGNVQPNSNFNANSAAIAIFDGLPGNVNLSYNLNGRFTTSGWSGSYEYSALLLSQMVSCTYRTNFFGSKLNPLTFSAQMELQLWAPHDIYDSQGIIGRSLGLTP